MITSGAVNDDLIEQFKEDIQEFDSVTDAFRQNGRVVKYRVRRNDDGFPTPHTELDGREYVVTPLTGGGLNPGDTLTRRVAVSPRCSECGENPQKGLDEDDDRCSDCAFGDNLLTAEPGQNVVVKATGDMEFMNFEPGEEMLGTADPDGIVRAGEDERVFNNGRFSIVKYDDGGS